MFAEASANDFFLTDEELWGGRDGPLWDSQLGRVAPFEYQRQALEDNHFCMAMVGEVGPGKTTLGCAKSMYLSLAHPNNKGVWGRLHENELYDSVFDAWSQLYPYEVWGPKGRDIFTLEGGENRPKAIRFFNGSVIQLVPMKSRSKFQGTNYGWAFIDQLEQISFEYFCAILKRLRRSNIPAAHQMLFSSVNKEGGYWWIKRVFEQQRRFGQLLPDEMSSDDFAVIYNPLHVNKRYKESGYYDRLERVMRLGGDESGIKRLIYSQDDDMYGRVLPDLNPETHDADVDFRRFTKESGEFWIGYDEGAEVPTAILLAYRMAGNRWFFGGEHYEAGLSVEQHKVKVKVLCEQLGFPLGKDSCQYVTDWAIRGKRGGRQESIADLWGEEWPWMNANKSREYGFKKIQVLSQDMDISGKPTFVIDRRRCPSLWDEIVDLQFDPERPGEWEFINKGGRGRGVMDHACDAMRYMIVRAMDPFPKKIARPVDEWKKTAGTRAAYEWAKKGKGRGVMWPPSGLWVAASSLPGRRSSSPWLSRSSVSAALSPWRRGA